MIAILNARAPSASLLVDHPFGSILRSSIGSVCACVYQCLFTESEERVDARRKMVIVYVNILALDHHQSRALPFSPNSRTRISLSLFPPLFLSNQYMHVCIYTIFIFWKNFFLNNKKPVIIRRRRPVQASSVWSIREKNDRRRVVAMQRSRVWV